MPRFLLDHISHIGVIVAIFAGDIPQGTVIVMVVNFVNHRGQNGIFLLVVGGVAVIHLHHAQVQKHHSDVFI